MVLAIPRFVGNVRKYLAILANALNTSDGSKAYSTTEVDTGATWLNGTTKVYRKVIAFANGPNNSEVSTAHGITGLALVLNMRARMNATTSHRQAPFVGEPNESKSTNDPTSIQLRVSGDNVLMKSVGNYSASAGHIILEYTKS